MISVLDQSKSKPVHANRYLTDIYIIFLKDVKCEDFHYGRNKYDYQEESLLFIAPGQVFGFDPGAGKLIQPRGWALTFHPDFIKGTSLGKKITEYGFFSYDVTEALHISKRERQTVLECFKKIKEELHREIDKHISQCHCEQHRVTSELLPTLLRSSIHYKGSRQQGCLDTFRRITEKLL